MGTDGALYTLPVKEWREAAFALQNHGRMLRPNAPCTPVAPAILQPGPAFFQAFSNICEAASR